MKLLQEVKMSLMVLGFLASEVRWQDCIILCRCHGVTNEMSLWNAYADRTVWRLQIQDTIG